MRRSIARLVPCLLLLGCAASAPPLVDLAPWSPPAGARCRVFGGDAPLAALLDSAAAVSAVETELQGAPVSGALLLSVAADTTGEVRRFRRIEATLPEPVAAAAEGAVAPLIVGRPGRRVEGRLHLVLQEGRVTGLALGPAQRCAPRRVQLAHAVAALGRVGERQQREGKVLVWMWVDASGAITESYVKEGTGDVPFDAALLDIARSIPFDAALVEREPEGVRVSLTLEVTRNRVALEEETPQGRGAPILLDDLHRGARPAYPIR